MPNDFGSSINDFVQLKEGLAIKHMTLVKQGVLIAASDSNLYCIVKSIDFSCYNCGMRNDHLSRDCTKIDQQYTRCPNCGVVARSKTSHKISCPNDSFRSQKIGEYELPFMEMHKIRFTFKNAETIYCAEETVNGKVDFLITKFFSADPNVKFQRVYDETNNIILDVEFKPSVSFGLYRTNVATNMASILFCENHVRINHCQHIDAQGIVSYNLSSFARMDDQHDIELKIQCKASLLHFWINWNNQWTADIIMSETSVFISPCK